MDQGEIDPLRSSVGMRNRVILAGFGDYLCVAYAVDSTRNIVMMTMMCNCRMRRNVPPASLGYGSSVSSEPEKERMIVNRYRKNEPSRLGGLRVRRRP